jgi:hypothetical protein
VVGVGPADSPTRGSELGVGPDEVDGSADPEGAGLSEGFGDVVGLGGLVTSAVGDGGVVEPGCGGVDGAEVGDGVGDGSRVSISSVR